MVPKQEQLDLMERLDGLCRASAGLYKEGGAKPRLAPEICVANEARSHGAGLARDVADTDMEALINDMANACVEATSMIERLGEALDAAVYDLQHMGGCPTCLHNRAPDRNRDIAICDAKRPFPKEGCYVWRFGGRDEVPTSARNSATPNEARTRDAVGGAGDIEGGTIHDPQR